MNAPHNFRSNIDEPLREIERTFGVKIDVPLLVEHKIVKGTIS
jgi:hypothetical protein